MRKGRSRGVGGEGENGKEGIRGGEWKAGWGGAEVGRAIYGGGGGLAVVMDNGEGKGTG